MSDVKSRIREIFKLWQRENSPGGQVFVRKDGELVFAECFGYADIERKIRVTPDTVFHVASVSKQITCMCVYLLRERGLVDIDADIRAYIPDLVAFDEPVTVRNMMNNISGIRDQWVLQILSGVRMGDIITQNDLIYLNKRQKELNFPPCSQYLYSNTNFLYLSEIVRRISGKTLNEFAKENIFVPLEMNSTFIRGDYDDLVENRALSYIDMGTGNFKWKPLNYSNNGATSLHTTAPDFMKWLDNFDSPTICSKETIEEMTKVPSLTTDNKTSYASGLMIDEKCGHKNIGHGGADAGYRSHVLHFPQDKLDIVIFANVENIPMGIAASKIADIVLGIDSSSKSDKFSPEKAEPVFGDFCITEIPMGLKIFEEKGQAYISYSNKKMPLLHEDGNRYACSYLWDKIYFTEAGPFLEAANNPYKMKPVVHADFSDKELSEISGSYYSGEVEAFYKIEVCNNKPIMIHRRFGTAEIMKVESDIYFCTLENDVTFKLKKSNAGEITGISIMDGRVLKIDFDKA